ncbi:RNA-binding protein 34, putative [Plasmodium malariae]|uniref:RNA-binding protein 34, putative n=1 Tax=Plasmodium malariae TaxID=5858 RepID=A0A1C3KAW9_PLAMA|nr:RNA-binding protein 34, putative [Plasmodium malariae]
MKRRKEKKELTDESNVRKETHKNDKKKKKKKSETGSKARSKARSKASRKASSKASSKTRNEKYQTYNAHIKVNKLNASKEKKNASALYYEESRNNACANENLRGQEENKKAVSKILEQLSSDKKEHTLIKQISSVVDFLNKNKSLVLPKGDKEKSTKKIEGKESVRTDLEKNKSLVKVNINNDERNKRTVFVGNLPLRNMRPSKLLKILNVKKSTVEAVRFRSQPIDEKYVNKKKLGVILKKFTDAKDNMNALITLKNKEDVHMLLEKSGTVYEGYVIRITKLGDDNFFNRKKSVCIKNLHKKLNERDLYEVMKEIDEIKGIRILRDEKTSCSTGVCFILFKNRSSVKKAIEMFNGKEINDRKVIVQRVLDHKEKDKAEGETKQMVKKDIKKGFKKLKMKKKKKKKYVRKKRTGAPGDMTN